MLQFQPRPNAGVATRGSAGDAEASTDTEGASVQD
jgi:hypothetical protein